MAVRTEVMVHEQNVMKSTKKRLHSLSNSTRGFAIMYQLSMVITVKSEKNEEATSEKRMRISSWLLLRPSSVIPMAMKRLTPKSTTIARRYGPIIVAIPSMNNANLLILKTRRSRSNLSNLKARRMLDLPGQWYMCFGSVARKTFQVKTINGTSQSSMTPSRTMFVSMMFHAVTADFVMLVKNARVPEHHMRNRTSVTKMQTKMLSRTGHINHSGWSVSPAIARVLKHMTMPMKVWKAVLCTK
mmetsp:Transcript_70447/g.210041  ORF Transcript_70447/g.210041 Transcript_70447/m.210041 type:complete len:243 (+) Transcript_70447:590-1318(+)